MDKDAAPTTTDASGAALLRGLITPPKQAAFAAGVVVGELLALVDGGQTALVAYPGQPGLAALPALRTLDLEGAHIGRAVVLGFVEHDPARPIVLGVLQETAAAPPPLTPLCIERGDGRLIVSARERLVLHCGAASITLTCDGHVDIRGHTVISQALEAHHVHGTPVELN